MIKINLLGNDTAVDHSGQLVIGAFCASLILTAGLCFYLTSYLGGEVADLTMQKAAKEKQLAQIQLVTQKVKDIEKKQRDLEERLVRIATLKRNKLGPVRVLDALNTAIPERAWLSEAREKGDIMRLEGLALDGETISQFMRELEKSDYFPKVELDVAKQVDRQGVKIQSFSIRATVSYAGKIDIEKAAVKESAPQPKAGK
jgi:type IV pilus assembly protein PilN